MTAKRSTGSRTHRFGGDWTTAKLDVIARYLASYTTALKDKPSKEHPFVKGYIDAFAGTGYRDARRDDRSEDASQALLLPDLAEAEPQALLDGSARLALKTEPRFDRYVFIERSPERCAQLELLKQEFPDLAKDIQVRRGDANSEIQDLCGKDWSSHRAVLFLDPYGMQVDWTTVEAIARTKAIDLWVLFPLGIGVNRLLTKSGDIPDSWRRRLNLLLGDRRLVRGVLSVREHTHAVRRRGGPRGEGFNRNHRHVLHQPAQVDLCRRRRGTEGPAELCQFSPVPLVLRGW